MLRRTKADELKNIPDKNENFIYTGLTKMQQEIYKNLIVCRNPNGVDEDSA
jgi:SNF2 family DNA or RNA helicase